MRDSKYLFVYEGKFMQYDSILEIKTGVGEESWESIVNHTFGFYTLMAAMRNIDKNMSREDIRIMRRLLRSIEFMKKIEPELALKFNIEKLIAQHTSDIINNSFKDILPKLNN